MEMCRNVLYSLWLYMLACGLTNFLIAMPASITIDFWWIYDNKIYIFGEKLRLLSGTLAKPEISKIKSIRSRWPIVDHGKFKFLQGCRSLSRIWTTKVMLKAMVWRQKININFEFLYCYGRIGMITTFGNKSFRSVFMASKNPVGHNVLEDFPLTQQMEG